MRAIVVNSERRLVFRDVDEPIPNPGELVVEVRAISLNRGEVRRSRTMHGEGHRPGWDFAGTVLHAAETGPREGARVVGILGLDGRPGAWAERVALPAGWVAELPADVTFAQASCLPVAGLTALLALEKRGDLLGRRVLVTGATGGVGHIAVQLAQRAGAQVIAAVRNDHQVDYARRLGADQVAVVGDDPSRSSEFGPYDLILDSVGGASAGASINMLRRSGVCVLFGASAGNAVSFNLSDFYFSGGASIYGLIVFDELARGEPPSEAFRRLLALVGSGDLRLDISLERPWTDIDVVADDLLDRRFSGKAVLHL